MCNRTRLNAISLVQHKGEDKHAKSLCFVTDLQDNKGFCTRNDVAFASKPESKVNESR